MLILAFLYKTALMYISENAGVRRSKDGDITLED